MTLSGGPADATAEPRALVTGAARGIGAAIADRLTRDGMQVLRVDLDGPDCLRCDVSDHVAVAALADQVGPVDVLVNNAAVWRRDPLEDADPLEFRRTFEVNVFGAFHMAQAFGRGMLQRGFGSIINVASISAIAVTPSVGAYAPSKAALVALTRQIAVDWGSRGVRCNAVGPGLVDTDSTRAAYEIGDARARRSAAVPLRRLATATDVADAVSFLASPQAAYITGQTIYVDGGLTQNLMQLIPD